LRKLLTGCILLVLFGAGCSEGLNKKQYYENGVEFLKNGNLNGAVLAFKKAIENDESYFEARYQLGLAYIAQEKYGSAERELLKVLKLNPSYDETHIALAKAYIGLSRTEDAIREIGHYLSKIRNNPEAYEIAASVQKDYHINIAWSQAHDIFKD
jgi:Tfp pilus assembly protein PilF